MPDQSAPRCTISVCREDPMWDHGTRWFMHPAHKLKELFVATYEVGHDEVPCRADVEHVQKLHPGCVLVYIGAPLF